MQFGENDELELRDEIASQWERGRPLSRREAKSKSDPWVWARLGTVQDTAALFGVHWKTIEVWRRDCGLPFFREGGVIRYVLTDVLAWASARKRGV
jgi:hypothetical protein